MNSLHDSKIDVICHALSCEEGAEIIRGLQCSAFLPFLMQLEQDALMMIRPKKGQPPTKIQTPAGKNWPQTGSQGSGFPSEIYHKILMIRVSDQIQTPSKTMIQLHGYHMPWMPEV
jgi:hypothetical protein